MSGLRLDKADAGQARDIVPGKSGESKLIQYVSGQGKVVMPPVGARLTEKEVAVLRSWIDSGAKWPAAATGGHWAFQKPVHPAPPQTKRAGWTRNAIDNFILARLESEGIAPSRETDKTTLIRRVTLDLTGLPPTPQEIDAFVADTRPDAYERLLDRLFDSPHFGEKWARYWLDLARYADSDGYEKDLSRPWAWRYRNWVIEAFNRDLPFDQFTIQQIAGDLLSNATLEQRVATGFHRNTLTNREGGTDPEQFRDEQVLDRTSTTGVVWLGLTFGCAQCHNHKYDPILQKDYYQLSAFFNTQEERFVDAPLPGELGPWLAAKPEYDRQRAAILKEYGLPEMQAKWEEKIRYIRANPGKEYDWDFHYQALRVLFDYFDRLVLTPPEQRTEREATNLTDEFLNRGKGMIAKLGFDEKKFEECRKKIADLKAKLPPLTQAPVLIESKVPPKTYIHVKGDWREHGPEVQAAFPSFLPAPKIGQPTRMDLAKWLVSRENPLTARVAVNRLWQEIFGRGIVKTSEDFGTQGDRPSHPELLDWLATEFMDRGWSTKQMIRLMVESATYRQASNVRPELLTRDPENVLLARQSRMRLPAELIRDEALAASGLLNDEIGGRSVKPPQPAGVSELSYNNSVKWVETKGPERYRRGLYVHYQRTAPYPMLVNFDEPNANLACSRRQRSNTPLQALNLLNDPVFFEAAQGLAYRVVTEAHGAFPDKLAYAYRLTLARKPKPSEVERLAQFFDHEHSLTPEGIKALFPTHIEGVKQSDAAAWVGISRALFNLDEFITRE